MRESYLILFFISISVVKLSLAKYNIKFEALHPRGLRVTIPDQNYSSVNFHGNLISKSYSKEWHMYMPRPANGEWILQDRNLYLLERDEIMYDIVLTKNGLRFQVKGTWNVTEFTNDYDRPDCTLSDTELPYGKPVCTKSTIFSEDFSIEGVENLTRWQLENMYPQEPDYPFNIFLTEAVTSVKDGILKIKPVLSKQQIFDAFIDGSKGLNNIYKCTGQIGTSECYKTLSGTNIMPPVISGKITTRKAFNFKYGKIVVRAKLPLGDWLIPEIILEPRDHEYGKLNYGSGIIRIALVKGNEDLSKELSAGASVYDKEPLRSRFLNKVMISDAKWSDQFHNYSVEWTPGGITTYVDDQYMGNINSFTIDPEVEDMTPNLEMQIAAWNYGKNLAPLNKMFYISLGVTVGGINNFAEKSDKPWKDISPKAMYIFKQKKQKWYPSWKSPELLVDYVKVYAL